MSETHSTIHVYLFLQHAALFWFTWMTSWVQLQKLISRTCRTVILVGGWRLYAEVRKKKKWMLCVHILFKSNLDIPLFVALTQFCLVFLLTWYHTGNLRLASIRMWNILPLQQMCWFNPKFSITFLVTL